MEFGSAFNTTPCPPSLDERMANVADQLESLIAVLSGGRPLPPPAPMQAVNAADAVNAVAGLKGNATASEIADALALRLAPGTVVSDGSSVLAAVQEMTKVLDHRLQGQRQAFGSAGTAEVKNITITETGIAQESTLGGVAREVTLAGLAATAQNIRRGLTDYEARLDYDILNNLTYSGKAPNGTATTAATWTIQKLSYTGANLTRVQVLTGAWDSRATLPW